MTERIDADLCIIGAGSGGLSVAAGAAQMGAKTVLIEQARMGGDCLNFGCVPSKSLLAAAHMAAAAHRAPVFGIDVAPPRIDGARVRDHVRDVIAAIAPHDSAERFEGLGVTVISASARFIGAREVVAGSTAIVARRIVIATGSRPAIPPIPGLLATPFLTNETLFSLGTVPAHLIVIGGGPVGVEMAQAHQMLGARVTLLEAAMLLPRDDPELVALLRRRLRADGIDVREGARVDGVSGEAGSISVQVTIDGQPVRIDGSHLLIATGRRANIEDLGLSAAGVTASPNGIRVDARLRTSNRRIFAIGDCIADGCRFTHAASHHAGVVLKNALFRWPAKADTRALPHVTYTDPELAQVGPTEAQAGATGKAFRVLRAPFTGNDRARAERQTDGLAKVIVAPDGHILGAGIIGPQAGELIQIWVLAIHQRLKIGAVATMIAPYPTLGEINKQVAGTYYVERIFGPATRRIVRLLSRFG